jgi:hypothetical protein
MRRLAARSPLMQCSHRVQWLGHPLFFTFRLPAPLDSSSARRFRSAAPRSADVAAADTARRDSCSAGAAGVSRAGRFSDSRPAFFGPILPDTYGITLHLEKETEPYC